MRLWRLHAIAAIAAIVTALLLLPASAALAHPSPGDATATRDYLQLALKRTRAEASGLPAALVAIEALRERLQSECPGVLAGEPKPPVGERPSSSAVLILQEIDAAVFGAAEHSEYQLRRDFAHAVSRLAWSDGTLTRLVHSHAAEEAEQSQIPAPDLCADLRSWVGSGYQTVSAATEAYVHDESTLSGETEHAEATIARELAREESAGDRRIAGQIAGIEKHALQTAVPKVIAALGEVGEVLHGPAS